MTRRFNGSDRGYNNNPVRQSSNSESSPETEIDLFVLTGLLVRRKKWIAAISGAVVVVACGIMLLMPNMYTSSAVILPSGGADKMFQLKDLAGLGSLTTRDENSSELFPVILQSRSIHDAVLKHEYSFTHRSEPMKLTLAEYFKQDNPDRLHRALAAITSVALDKKTGVIGISVETKYPEFSQQVLNRYLAELETFNLHKRRSQARDNARYLDRQFKAIEQELALSEDSMEQFQLVNRDWTGSTSPEILKQLARFERDIALKSKTYLFLRQEYEVAKLDAQKDVPIVRVLDSPSLPVQKSGPRRLMTVVISGMVALFLSVFSIIALEGLKKRGSGPDRQSYHELTSDLRREFPRVARLVTRRSGEEAVPTDNARNRIKESGVTAD
ncbi:MAG: Wzz/FepE/Etk N-terminal domain-containing protein [bacterium]